MNIFKNTTRSKTVALIFFSLLAIASGVFDSFYRDIPNEFCEFSSIMVFILCVSIFIDNYKVASKDREQKRLAAEELVCLIRRQTGVCPLVHITCSNNSCCNKQYELSKSAEEKALDPSVEAK